MSENNEEEALCKDLSNRTPPPPPPPPIRRKGVNSVTWTMNPPPQVEKGKGGGQTVSSFGYFSSCCLALSSQHRRSGGWGGGEHCCLCKHRKKITHSETFLASWACQLHPQTCFFGYFFTLPRRQFLLFIHKYFLMDNGVLNVLLKRKYFYTTHALILWKLSY